MLDAGPVEGEGRTRHYAWVILGVAFLGLLGAQGVRLAFGAFLEPWEVDFDLSRGAVAAIGAVSYLVYGAAQPLVGLVTDRVNLPRLFAAGMVVIAIGLLLVANSTTGLGLTVAYGLVSSVGFGISASVVASVLITRWFVARRGLAFGILEAGFGAGQLTLAPLSLFAIARWGWQPTMVGFAVFLGLFLAPLMVLLLKNRPEDVGLEPLGGPDPEVGEESSEGSLALLKRVEFWYLGIPFFVCGVTTTGMIDTHLIPFSHDHGNGDGITSAAVGVLALFNIIGTAGSGLLVDKYDPRHLLGWLYALRAVSLVLVLVLNQGFWLIQFGVLFGLVDFATVAPTQTLVSRYFGGRALGFVFGLILFSHQIGSAVGSYVPGRIHDVTGSYNVAFLGAALTLVAASFLSFRLPRRSANQAYQYSS